MQGGKGLGLYHPEIDVIRQGIGAAALDESKLPIYRIYQSNNSTSGCETIQISSEGIIEHKEPYSRLSSVLLGILITWQRSIQIDCIHFVWGEKMTFSFKDCVDGRIECFDIYALTIMIPYF